MTTDGDTCSEISESVYAEVLNNASKTDGCNDDGKSEPKEVVASDNDACMEVECTPRCSPAEVHHFVELNEDEVDVQAVPTKESPAVKEDTSSSPVSSWNGFKLVGDNLDKTVKPHYIRMNRQNHSLNYFHAFAVKDRIDLRSFLCMYHTNIGVNTH